MRPAVLLAFEVEAGDVPKDVQPGGRVATDLDLRLNRSKRVEGLVEQIAHHAGLRRITSGANVADREIVVHPHVALDETGHLPVVRSAVIALEHEDVATAGRAAIALPPALMIGMGQGGADRATQRRGVRVLCRSDAVRQPSFFHAPSCRTA